MHEYNTLHPWRPGDGLPTEGILMLRHGPRGGGDLPSMDEPLTDDGIEAAKCVGRRWMNQTEPIFVSSPVNRCLHTSQLLAEAAGWDIEILETEILGDPGPFVVDSKLLRSHDEDILCSLKAHINGNQIPGMLGRDVGVERMMLERLKLKGSSKALIACTHDRMLSAVSDSYGLQCYQLLPYLER